MENNKMIIFDIIENEIKVNLSSNPSQKNQKYMYEDDQQFNVFVFCRTSDVFNDRVKENGELVKRQRVKY